MFSFGLLSYFYLFPVMSKRVRTTASSRHHGDDDLPCNSAASAAKPVGRDNSKIMKKWWDKQWETSKNLSHEKKEVERLLVAERKLLAELKEENKRITAELKEENKHTTAELNKENKCFTAELRKENMHNSAIKMFCCHARQIF